MAKALDKNKKRRDDGKDFERRARDHYKAARKKRSEAKAERKRKRKQARQRCRKGKARARDKATATFKKDFQAARRRQKKATQRRHEKRRRTLDQARQACEVDLQQVDAEVSPAIAEAERQAAELRDSWQLERQANRINSRRRRRPGNVTTAQRRRERRQESDDAVRANLQPHELAIFERLKRHIRGNARMSRTEAFQHWLQEHPDELHAALSPTDEQLAAGEAAYFAERHAAAASGGEPDAGGDADWFADPAFQSPAALSDHVPF